MGAIISQKEPYVRTYAGDVSGAIISQKEPYVRTYAGDDLGVGNYSSLADAEAACDAAAGCQGFTYEGTGEPTANKPVRARVRMRARVRGRARVRVRVRVRVRARVRLRARVRVGSE